MIQQTHTMGLNCDLCQTQAVSIPYNYNKYYYGRIANNPANAAVMAEYQAEIGEKVWKSAKRKGFAQIITNGVVKHFCKACKLALANFKPAKAK